MTLSSLKPKIALPHSPARVVDAEEMKGEGIDQIFIGSCAGGRLRDLELTALLLKKKRIDPRTQLLVTPASNKIYQKAIERGYIQTILEAGGVILNPSCGPCGGIDKGILGERGEVLEHLQQELSGQDGGSLFQSLSHLSPYRSGLCAHGKDHGSERGDGMSLPEIISGRVWKLGDHVNTDVIHPSSYFSLDEKRVKEGVLEGMERLGSDLNRDSLGEGIIIVAGENFGCGSSRETSVRGLRGSGVKAVVAASFARIFMRSLINLGIPTLECKELQNFVKDGDLIRLFLREGWIELTGSRRVTFSPIDHHHQKILEAGGLLPYLRREKDGI